MREGPSRPRGVAEAPVGPNQVRPWGPWLARGLPVLSSRLASTAHHFESLLSRARHVTEPHESMAQQQKPDDAAVQWCRKSVVASTNGASTSTSTATPEEAPTRTGMLYKTTVTAPPVDTKPHSRKGKTVSFHSTTSLPTERKISSGEYIYQWLNLKTQFFFYI